ncbi:MAG: hypothetical protein Q4P72_03960 [Eubacteriales bacterium]|nr:hypothetical protein [Eubacteriales bacterium]
MKNEASASPNKVSETMSKRAPSWLGVLLIIFGMLCLALLLYQFQSSKSAGEIEHLSKMNESRLSSLEASLQSELEDKQKQFSEALEKEQKSVDDKFSRLQADLNSQMSEEKQNLEIDFAMRQQAIASSLYDDQIELRKNLDSADASLASQLAAEHESLRSSLAEEHESLKSSLEERQEAVEKDLSTLKSSASEEIPTTAISPEQSSSSQAPSEIKSKEAGLTKDPLKLGPDDIWEVDGLFRVSINSVYLSEARNTYADERAGFSPKYVVCINYGYENLGLQRGFVLYPDTVTDQDKRIGKSYPNVMSNYPQFLPTDSLQEEAEDCFAFNKEVKTVGIYFIVYDDDFNKHEAKFTIPLLSDKREA